MVHQEFLGNFYPTLKIYPPNHRTVLRVKTANLPPDRGRGIGIFSEKQKIGGYKFLGKLHPGGYIFLGKPPPPPPPRFAWWGGIFPRKYSPGGGGGGGGGQIFLGNIPPGGGGGVEFPGKPRKFPPPPRGGGFRGTPALKSHCCGKVLWIFLKQPVVNIFSLSSGESFALVCRMKHKKNSKKTGRDRFLPKHWKKWKKHFFQDGRNCLF